MEKCFAKAHQYSVSRGNISLTTFATIKLSKKAEARRLSSWFDKFHSEVTSNLLYERVYKDIKNWASDSDLIKRSKKNKISP